MVVFKWWSANVVEVITGLVGECRRVSKVGIMMVLLVMNLIDIRVKICAETPENDDGDEDNSSESSYLLNSLSVLDDKWVLIKFFSLSLLDK